MDSVSRDEINSLVDIALDDLESSKVLCQNGNYRNSVSLAYYSMFSMARALLLIKGYTPKTHNGLLSLFGKEYVLGEGFDAGLASEFSSTQVVRENASYAYVDDFTEKQAIDKISLAEDFIDEAMKFIENVTVEK